jgi:outer membrane murein-binding lipoprotein Lpp
MNRTVLLVVVVFALCLALGCSHQQAPAPTTSTAATLATKTDVNNDIVYLKADVNELKSEVTELREYLENDPRFLLRAMDRDLDSVESGREPRGSFSDYFVPNAAKALRAGASKKEVTSRIDRVIALAEKKVYLSSYVRELMETGGPAAVRSYADHIFVFYKK